MGMDAAKPGIGLDAILRARAISDSITDQALHLSAQIEPMLAGKGSMVQGAVLANLTALWLAGHFGGPGIREKLIEMHMEMCKALMPVHEAEILARAPKQ